MDHGQGEICYFLVCWLLGLLAVIACVMQCLMDMHVFLFVCLDGWVDGWMDGRMDPVLPHVPEASGSVSGGSRRSGQSLRSFRRIPKG